MPDLVRSTPPRHLPVRLRTWRLIQKGSLLGLADVILGATLLVRECPVLVSSKGTYWATLPSKPALDGDKVRRNGGKIVYSPVLEFEDADMKRAFSDAVVAAVRAAYPGDFLAGQGEGQIERI